MAKFIVTKQVDFGPYSIINQAGCASCFVPLNDYAPKVGEVIEGEVVTKLINDGNGHVMNKTGIVWPIYTNGAASTPGQTSIQFISQDHFQPYTQPVIQDNPQMPVTPPTNTVVAPGNISEQINAVTSDPFKPKNILIILLVVLVIYGILKATEVI